MPQRCTGHGLATGPDGLCVICRRELLVTRERKQSFGIRSQTVFLIVLASAFGALGIIGVIRYIAFSYASTSGAGDIDPTSAIVPIALYEADWCPHCRNAKAWFRARGLNITDYDVEHDKQANRDMRRYNPRGTLPTIVIGDKIIVGFDEKTVSRVLAEMQSKQGSERAAM